MMEQVMLPVLDAAVYDQDQVTLLCRIRRHVKRQETGDVSQKQAPLLQVMRVTGVSEGRDGGCCDDDDDYGDDGR